MLGILNSNLLCLLKCLKYTINQSKTQSSLSISERSLYWDYFGPCCQFCDGKCVFRTLFLTTSLHCLLILLNGNGILTKDTESNQDVPWKNSVDLYACERSGEKEPQIVCVHFFVSEEKEMRNKYVCPFQPCRNNKIQLKELKLLCLKQRVCSGELSVQHLNASPVQVAQYILGAWLHPRAQDVYAHASG